MGESKIKIGSLGGDFRECKHGDDPPFLMCAGICKPGQVCQVAVYDDLKPDKTRKESTKINPLCSHDDFDSGENEEISMDIRRGNARGLFKSDDEAMKFHDEHGFGAVPSFENISDDPLTFRTDYKNIAKPFAHKRNEHFDYPSDVHELPLRQIDPDLEKAAKKIRESCGLEKSDLEKMSEAGLRGAAAGRKLGRFVNTPHQEQSIAEWASSRRFSIVEQEAFKPLSVDIDLTPQEIAFKKGVQCGKTAQVTLSITGIDMQQRNLFKRFFRWCLAKWRSDTHVSYTDQNGNVYNGWRSRNG